jgi:hypothetical protein
MNVRSRFLRVEAQLPSDRAVNHPTKKYFAAAFCLVTPILGSEVNNQTCRRTRLILCARAESREQVIQLDGTKR